MFNIGDEVICIDPGKTKLVYGKKYKIVYRSFYSYDKKDCYNLVVEGIPTNVYRKTRFRKITRLEKIKKIKNLM